MKQKYNAFICCSYQDYMDMMLNNKPDNYVFMILQALKDAGITFWIEKQGIGIHAGDVFENVVPDAIDNSSVFVFISSESSNNSRWNLREIVEAQNAEKKIISVRIDSSEDHGRLILNELDFIDFTNDPKKGCSELVRSIRVYLDGQQQIAEEKEQCETMKMRKQNEALPMEDSCGCCPCPPLTLEQPKGITFVPRSRKSMWQRLKFWGHKDERQEVYSSVFAPAEISKGRNLLVQVYLHLAEEEDKVIDLSHEAQSDAIRKGYDSLNQHLKVGEVVNVTLTIYGSQGSLDQSEKTIQWKGHFSKCDFCYVVPQDIIDVELSCELIFRLNSIPFPIGEMTFISSITKNPRALNANISSKTYRHAFVSYAHKDRNEVELIIKTLKAIGVKFFYDKLTLSGGDVFDEVIMENIDKSDLFILCWSRNSADSQYVHKEIERALPRAYPQVKPRDTATLKIFPISIEPKEELPDYLKGIYHFESLYTQ